MEAHDILFQPDLISPVIMWVCFIIMPGFVGAYASDYIKKLKHEEMKVSLIRVILATVIACIITFIFMDWLIEINRKPVIPFITLVLGLLGFELLHGLSSINNIVALLKKLSKVLTHIVDMIDQVNEARKLIAAKRGKKDGEQDAEGSDTDQDS